MDADWTTIDAAARSYTERTVRQGRHQLPGEATTLANERTAATGTIHVTVLRQRRQGLRLIGVDSEPLVSGDDPFSRRVRDPFGLRTLSFISTLAAGPYGSVPPQLNIDRLIAAIAEPDVERPPWHLSVWCEIACTTKRSGAVAAAAISAVEEANSELAAAVATALILDRGLTEAEADVADHDDSGIGEHLLRLGFSAGDLVGTGTAGARQAS